MYICTQAIMISKTLDATETILCLPLRIHPAFNEHVSATQIRMRRPVDSHTHENYRAVAIMTNSNASCSYSHAYPSFVEESPCFAILSHHLLIHTIVKAQSRPTASTITRVNVRGKLELAWSQEWTHLQALSTWRHGRRIIRQS